MIRRGLVTATCLLALLAATAGAQSVAKEPSEKPYGIPRRVPWTTSKLVGSPEPPPPYRLRRVFSSLRFEQPVELTTATGSPRLFVVELKGKIYSFPTRGETAQPDLFADFATSHDKFYRLYGLAFHPNFAQNRTCYVCYVSEKGLEAGTRVSRFRVTRQDPPALVADSEQIVLTWPSGGHNGGSLKFGPDGYLYISTGDAANPFPADGRNTGQDVSDLLSSILRIDVDRPGDTLPYSVPPDNPFVKQPGARGEVWAYGLRNPWRMSFDAATGDLWVGDVGWEMWEMIYRVQPGGNYGWSLVEGKQPVHIERKRGPTPILPPTAQHSHDEARSITGGFVYRGRRLKPLVGAYIYGDYVTGKMWALRHDGQRVTWQQELADTTLDIICFGEDQQRELYVVGYDGTLHELVPNPQTASNRDFPRKLSETGLFASVKQHTPAPGVIPYSVNAEPWADHATAERFLALPGREQLDIEQEQDLQRGKVRGHWKFPHNAVLAKTLSLEMKRGDPASRRRLETQVLHYHHDTWNAYTYVWNDEQNDAILAPAEGLTRELTVQDARAPGGRRVQSWRFASRTECVLCHTTRAGSILGFLPEQLNRTHDYGNVVDHQLRTLDHIGLFAQPLPDELPHQPDPANAEAELALRARSYLHVNCAHCHRRGGGGTAAFDIQFKFDLQKTNLLSGRPTQGTFGIYRPEVVAAGDPYRSVLLYRMAKLGRGRMPHFGSQVVDEAGLRLIRDWIGRLPASQSTAAAKRLRGRQRAALRRLEQADAPASEREQSISELLATPSGAVQVMFAVDEVRLPAAVRTEIFARAADAPPEVRDLLERYLPPEQRRKRLGDAIRPEQVLSQTGNAERGRRLFFESKTMQCKNCHRIGEAGKPLGPDLNDIGKKYSAAELLAAILEPSRKIDPKFITYVVETAGGQVHTGLLVRKTDAEIVLKDPQHREIRVPATEVEAFVPQRKSLMPEMQLRDMTAQEAADLIEYLSTLK